MASVDLRSFFDSYGDAFTRDAGDIALFYNVPCITARAGNIRMNSSEQEVEAFFTGVLTKYREQGNTHGVILSITTTDMGQNAVSATVRWAYKNARSETLWESTFSYTVYNGPKGWKILAQTMHDEAY